jgi:dipeptidyl aminopeptidase/acylaminoacyl peptidase
MIPFERLLAMRMAYAGRFDADGRHLLFVSDLAGRPQPWRIAAAGWPELVAPTADRAQTIHAGPRPSEVVIGEDVGGNERTQLLLVDDRRSRPLTDSPERIHVFGDFSPDGGVIAYSANLRDPRWFDVYVRDLKTGETNCVLQADATNYAGRFSPDGRSLIVSRVFSSAHNQLWLVDLAGGAPPRLLTPETPVARYLAVHWLPDGSGLVLRTDLGRDLDAAAILSLGDGSLRFILEPSVEIDTLALTRDGRRLAYALNRDGAAQICVRDLEDGSERSLEGLPEGGLYEYWQPGLAWDRAGTRLAISWTSSRHPPDIWVHDASTGRTRQTTRMPRAGVPATRLVDPEHVSYATFDGRRIPALYYAARKTDGPPACVVMPHGGPEGQSRPVFNPVIQFLVSAGFAVLAPNVRGSTGYGKAYHHLDDVRLRMDSVTDLAHGVYWLRESGRADPRRIAVYGGSYGGFMVLAALTTYPDLWAAGVDLVGIANFVTFLEHTGPWRRHLREAEYGSLERDREFLESISPIHKVDRIAAPLLVIHGANDPRVPIGEAEQIVGRLRSLGRTVEFLRLDDEGHAISKQKNRQVVYPMAADFLRRHVLRRRG